MDNIKVLPISRVRYSLITILNLIFIAPKILKKLYSIVSYIIRVSGIILKYYQSQELDTQYSVLNSILTFVKGSNLINHVL